MQHDAYRDCRCEIKRRTNVVGIIPDEASVLRLARSILLEVHDEWQIAERRYAARRLTSSRTDAEGSRRCSHFPPLPGSRPTASASAGRR